MRSFLLGILFTCACAWIASAGYYAYGCIDAEGGRWRDAIGPKVGERRIAKARSGPHNGSHGTFNKGEEHEKFDGSFDVGGWTYRDASARQLFDWERVGRVLLRR